MSETLVTIENTKNRTETGQKSPPLAPERATSRLPKTHQDYWRARLKKRTYRDESGTLYSVPEYQVRFFYQRREVWIPLGTANQAAAALKARDAWVFLLANGWEATLNKFKPLPEEKTKVCTLGEFLREAEKVGHLKPKTLANYSLKFRALLADIGKIDRKLSGRRAREKYDWITGKRDRWNAAIEALRLDLLTHHALAEWRNAYVARAGHDMAKRKSAERSAASILRCVRALFNEHLTRVMEINLPPNPFEHFRIPSPGPQRYISRIDPAWLLNQAEQELRPRDPQAYLAFQLTLWGGLRRKEADLLQWEQLDLEHGELHVRRTEFFEPKTEESQRVVDLPRHVVDILRGYKQGCTSPFVMDGNDPYPEATYDAYRCDHTWRRLLAWLRSKGITEVKAVHSLRKESGSLIATQYGIEAARQHLGHRDISTTSAHYVCKKRRFEVSVDVSRGYLREIA